VPSVRMTELAAAPPEQVWAAQIDGPRIAAWFPGARSVGEISGPLDRPGTTYVLRFNRILRSRVEVTEVQAPVMHTRMWDARPFGSYGRATVLLRSEEGGTRVDFDVNFELPLGPLGRLFERLSFVRRRAARNIRRELHAFCQFAEQGGR
jgi:carbon monoxide dehydrogenase subunit G